MNSLDSDYLSGAEIYSEEEFITKRRDKLKKLILLYRTQYHRMRNVVHKSHSKFIKATSAYNNNNKSIPELINKPIDLIFKEQLKQKQNNMTHYIKASMIADDKKKRKLENVVNNNNNLNNNNNNNNLNNNNNVNTNEIEKTRCKQPQCKSNCMPLTNYCYAHVLNDPKQKLFSSCSYVNRENVTTNNNNNVTNNYGSSCNYPVLIGQYPPLCNGHLELEYPNLHIHQIGNPITANKSNNSNNPVNNNLNDKNKKRKVDERKGKIIYI